MAKKKGFELRFSVGGPALPSSSVWRAWSNRSEVYIGHRDHAGIQKLSFHRSRICRHAFTKAYGTPKTLRDRAMNKWERPLLNPTCLISYAAVLHFPTDYLSKYMPVPNKPVMWLDAAPASHHVVVECFFTFLSEDALQQLPSPNKRSVLSYALLPSNEAFVMISYTREARNNDLYVPASHGSTQDIFLSSIDPWNTGRPLRMTLFGEPEPGKPMIITEYGAYAVPVGTNPAGHLQSLANYSAGSRHTTQYTSSREMPIRRCS